MNVDRGGVHGPRAFMASAGRFATEALIACMARGEELSPMAWRICADDPNLSPQMRGAALLRRDEWIFFDEQVVRGAQLRLVGVRDLIAAGLTKPITNALGKTILEYEKINDFGPATVSLDGVTRSENDTLEFTDAGIPLPITHKDWYLNLRRLAASRSRGESLDGTSSQAAGQVIGEMAEFMLFRGGKQFGGLPIYGYTTHPDRITVSFGAGGTWANPAKTGSQIVGDIGTMINYMESIGKFGPYWIYVGADASVKFIDDYKAESDRTIRERVLAINRIQKIEVADQLPAGNVVMVQATPDTVQWVMGENLQTIQWDVYGGFQINFKAFQIQIPLIKSDDEGKTGIVHMA